MTSKERASFVAALTKIQATIDDLLDRIVVADAPAKPKKKATSKR